MLPKDAGPWSVALRALPKIERQHEGKRRNEMFEVFRSLLDAAKDIGCHRNMMDRPSATLISFVGDEKWKAMEGINPISFATKINRNRVMTKGVAIRRPSMPRLASMSYQPLNEHSTRFWIPSGNRLHVAGSRKDNRCHNQHGKP